MSAAGVSVALCTFNGARYLEEQLRSILAQGDFVDEIIVADDGSTDDTITIARRIAAEAESAGLRVHFQLLTTGGGHGVTKNFERAISACRNDLIALADQDDVWLPGKLRRMVGAFATSPALLFLHTDARLVDENGTPTGERLLDTLEIGEREREAIHRGEAFGLFLRRNLATGATSMIRRRLLESALPFPASWVHDEWLAMIAAATGRLDFLPEPLIDYRQHGANQIGVRAPTLRVKVRRVLEERGDRNRELAERSASLVERLSALDAAPEILSAAQDKAVLERFRAELPGNRFGRVLPVLREALSGSYRRFASQGALDVVRDLLQPAGTRR